MDDRLSPKRVPPACRPGITLVEVLVTIGVISLLVALLLPAVQSAREAARRTGCRNNLHQLGLALQSYHDTHRAFPPGSTSYDGSLYGRPRMPPAGGLLPYLDQAALFNQIVYSRTVLIFKDPANLEVVKVPLPIFRCPSDGVNGSTKDQSSWFLPGEWSGPFPNALTNYGGIYGRLQRDAVIDNAGNGGPPDDGQANLRWMFGVNSGTRLADVTDGASNTLLFAEVLTGTPEDSRGSLWIGNAGHGCVFTELGPNSPDPDLLFRISGRLCNPGAENVRFRVPCVEGDEADPDSNNTATSRSWHLGGVHALLADGSVRFLGDSIAITVWRNLGSINDGAATSLE